MQDKKRKPLIEDFSVPFKGFSYARNCNSTINFLKCLCEDDDGIGFKCFKCGSYTHNCLERQLNRGQLFQCAPCINKAMDPIFTIKKVLVESYLRIDKIFDYVNQTTFQFMIGSQDLLYPIEIRALKPGITSLSYPMQGIFQINQRFFHELRPLKINSNRKHRREEFITIPSDYLRLGINTIRFRIPVLDKDRYTEFYQHEDHAVYYMSVNSIQEIKKETLIRQTFGKRRLDKPESLGLLTQQSGEIQVTQTKLCLVCPYTKERIKVPVRGRYCKHFTCICLETLIASHIKSRFWGCPLCQCKISEPFVDIWIYGMLKDNQHGTDVLVQSDGTYTWVNNQQEVLDLDSEDQDDVRVVPSQEIDSKLFNPHARADLREARQKYRNRNLQLDSSNEVGPAQQIDNIVFTLTNQVDPQSRIEAVRKMLNTKIKQKVLQVLNRQSQQQNPPSDQGNVQEVQALKKGQISKDRNRVNTQQKMIGRNEGFTVIKEVRQLRVKEQSYDTFRKKYMTSQLAFAKKMKSFLDQFPNLKYIFKEVIN